MTIDQRDVVKKKKRYSQTDKTENRLAENS